MGRNDGRDQLVPAAQEPLDRLKYEVAREIGLLSGPQTEEGFAGFLDSYKYEVADELGLGEKIRQVGWGNMTSRECGTIGGHIGGRLGGQMVKRMIEFAERNMR